MKLEIQCDKVLSYPYFDNFDLKFIPSSKDNGPCYENGILGHRWQKKFYYIDFDAIALKLRKQHLKSSDLMARAIGGYKYKDWRFVDATCGMGEDLIYAKNFFKKCHGIERNPYVSLLLMDAKRRSSLDDLEISYQDALSFRPVPESVIYIDPMYPSTKKKKSLAKKEMELLKYLCGDDLDQNELVEHFLKGPGRRVIVKRPQRAPILFENKLTHQFIGKNIRYDLYCK